MSKSLDRLTLLETFVRIADAGSISAAARDLGLSQPSVSRQLAELESRFKTQLMQRTTHTLSLTAAGAELLADARRLLDDWEAIEDRYINADSEVRGRLKVIAPVALGQLHLIDIAIAFQQQYPNVSLSWQLEDHDIRFAEVGCDCWIKIGPVLDTSLAVTPLCEVERLAVAAPPLLKTQPSQVQDLEALPWLALEPFEGGRIPLTHADGQITTLLPDVRLATNNIFALRQATLAGLGISVLPRWFIQTELQKGSLVDILPSWRAPRLTIHIAYLSTRHQPIRLQRFIEQMVSDVPIALNSVSLCIPAR
ncbi:MAG: LysR family transcriptional regulator [Cyanobacteria bacterium P01_D01_bin.14]